MSGFIAVHTGAGSVLNDTPYKKICKEACIRGTEVLKQGGTVLDACEQAIIVLEDNGHTNAAYGSNLTWDGRVECDASIMEGHTLHYGACTNVSDVINPISLARAVCDRQAKLLTMDRIPPLMVAGLGASKYAKEANVPTTDQLHLMISKRAQKTYDHFRGKLTRYEDEYNLKIMPLDTVGAICVDSEGNCAAGCSSGGLILKIPGRVGQAATYGAGCFANKLEDKSAATCTTGNGEYLIKTLLARDIVDGLLRDECPVTSLHKTFKENFVESPYLRDMNEVFGGALSIVYDQTTGNGEVLWSHTTNALCLAHMTTMQKAPKFIASELPSYLKQGYSTVVNGQHFKLTL